METFNNGNPIRRIIERKADGTIIGWGNVDLYDGTDSDMTTADKFRPSDFVSKTNGGADKREVTLWEDLEVVEISFLDSSLSIKPLFTLTDSINRYLMPMNIGAIAERCFKDLTGEDCNPLDVKTKRPSLVDLSDAVTKEVSKLDDQWQTYPFGLRDYISDCVMELVEHMSWLYQGKW